MKSQGVYARYIKRILDVICSVLFLTVFWWVYVILAVLVRVNLGSPVIFKQPRPGKDGKIFHMYKFRTMTDERDEQGNLLPDDVRLTKFGKFLRSASLDELPEVWLILTGKLSFVGPRPLLVQYMPLYNEHQARRHEVRPGLTGYAQAYGRNLLTWEEKFDKDIYYVDHISLWLDIKVIFKTVMAVLRREGISSETSATMEVFQGTKSED